MARYAFYPAYNKVTHGFKKGRGLAQNGATAKTAYRVTELSQNSPTAFLLRPDRAQMEAIAQELGLLDLRKLTFAGELRSEGRRDWRLEAELGATVVQPCVVSLEPVTTRLDEPIRRLFVADMPEVPASEEMEMPEDDTQEPLGTAIDLNAVMIEALALALPDYPRRDDAALEQTEFTPPDAAPIEEPERKPFAALAELKQKLERDD